MPEITDVKFHTGICDYIEESLMSSIIAVSQAIFPHLPPVSSLGPARSCQSYSRVISRAPLNDRGRSRMT